MSNGLESIWMSSRSITVLVCVVEGKIVSGPPIVTKFIGQPVMNLRNWMKNQGEFSEKRLD